MNDIYLILHLIIKQVRQERTEILRIFYYVLYAICRVPIYCKDRASDKSITRWINELRTNCFVY